ncbi:MAG: hypothetical protein WD342_07210 [Verrucomicrobiales bacterium]
MSDTDGRQKRRLQFASVQPLVNPLRLAEAFLVWSLWITVIVYLSVFAILAVAGDGLALILGVVSFVLGLIVALLFYRGITLLFRGGKTQRREVLYLRAFRSDEDSSKLRSWIKGALGNNYNLSGIRAPRNRSNLLASGLNPVIKGLRYAGSQHFDLEAPGRNWLVRLLKSMSTTQFCFMDVRHVTPHVITEVKLAMEVFGTERTIFVIDDQCSTVEWRAKIVEFLGSDSVEVATFKMFAWPDSGEMDPEVCLAQMKRLTADIPSEPPTISDEALRLVSEVIDPKEWPAKFGETHGSSLAISLIALNAVGLIAGYFLGEFVKLIGIPVTILVVILFLRSWSRFKKQRNTGRIINPEETDPENTISRSWRYVMLPILVGGMIPLLLVAAMPAYSDIEERGKRIRSVSNVRQITLACQAFARDWDWFPAWDPYADDSAGGEGEEFSTSTEAFNALIPNYLDVEYVFWTQTKDPERPRPPNEDNTLEPSENVYLYVVGQTDTSYSRSPLVADGLMESPGHYGKYHPWLKSKKAIVGYVGGHVTEEDLTSSRPGATIRASDDSTDNIFLERSREENGDGGFLATSPDNILLP